ncbi:MAG: hypothetical protein E7232_08645 [Lachnospiraceae bacterium]|nr:hypothetical protein [Lachnospiraceae bacterium]
MKKKILTLALVVGLALSSITASYAASSSTNDRSSSSSSSSVTTGGTTSVATNASGQTVTKTEYSANGVNMTTSSVGTDGTSLAQADFQNGAAHVTLRTTTGGADVGPNGEAICKSAILVITENGVSVGCFVDPATGLPMATGADATYWAYDANGNLVLHYVNAMGYFYTGTQIINGQTVIFNDEGVIVG